MRKFSDELLVFFLAALVGLSPLQNVMADYIPAFDWGEEVHQLAGMHGDMPMDTDHVCADCEQCNPGNGCVNHNCPSNQCAFCTLAILPDIFCPIYLTGTPRFSWTNTRFVSQLNFFLFRPPKT